MRKLKISDGDCVVVTFKQRLNDADIREVSERLREMISSIGVQARCVVLDQRAELKVTSKR